MTNALAIRGYGPYPIGREGNVFTSEIAGRGGVYLWGLPTRAGWLVDFAGEAKCFRIRLAVHRDNYLTGWYRLWDPDAYARAERVLVWGGTYFTHQPFRQEFAPVAHALLAHMAVLLLPLEGNAYWRRRIEDAIIRALRADPVAGAFFDDTIRHPFFRRGGEPPVSMELDLTTPVTGLPKFITI